MGVSISDQALVFLGMAACGAVIGIIFDMFRTFRKLARPGALGVNLSDLLFWVIGICVLIGSLVFLNSGELRWYVFIGLFLGGILYFSLLSQWILKFFIQVCRIFTKIIRFIFKILLTPALFLYKILISPLCRIIGKLGVKIRDFFKLLYGGVTCAMKQKKKPAHVKPKPKDKKAAVLRVLFIALLCFMVVRGVMQQPQITKNKAQIAQLQEQISYEEKRMEEVDSLKSKVNTDEYIEKVAREKLGLVKANEKIFVDAADSGK